MSSSPPARRSDATKAAIVAAARERFAADGYERATIRAIAEAAAIDPAMVMRYFGNKEKLFVAAAEFDLHLPDLGAVKRSSVGPALVAHFLDRWEHDETLVALLRAAATHESAAERMQALFASQLAPLVEQLAGKPGAATRAALVATQMLGFALGRYVLRLAPVVALTRAEAIHWLGPTLQRYLLDDLPTTPRPTGRRRSA